LNSGVPADGELEQHLDALVQRCLNRTRLIAALAARADCQVTIEAVLHLDSTADAPSFPGMWFAPHVVQFAADCGIGIDADVYLSRAQRDRHR
jgi:hypothetical protein